jgi:transposase
MSRKAKHSHWEVDTATALLPKAKNVHEFRQLQAILLPALLGLTLKQVAELLGLSRDRVVVLRREFRRSRGIPSVTKSRGGRHHQLLTEEEEISFIKPWLEKSNRGETIHVPALHAELEAQAGRAVPKSTVYRLLARHGWKKQGLDTDLT